MRVHRHADAASLLARAGPFLVEREAFHNQVLGVLSTCVADATRYPGPNYFAVVEDEGRVVGVAAMTPPYHLQNYAPPGAATDAVVADLAQSEFAPTGVNGPREFATAFAERWTSARGLFAKVHMDLRAFELTHVNPPPAPPGAARPATSADVTTVEDWYVAFHEEARMPPGNVSWRELGRRSVADGRVFLWDDDGPVAQTVVVGGTPNGARIDGIYTPPGMRRRGYATALVADVSRAQLAAGRKFCFLFTDLANPTSNSIYPKVGYRPVADFRDFEFVAAKPA